MPPGIKRGLSCGFIGLLRVMVCHIFKINSCAIVSNNQFIKYIDITSGQVQMGWCAVMEGYVRNRTVICEEIMEYGNQGNQGNIATAFPCVPNRKGTSEYLSDFPGDLNNETRKRKETMNNVKKTNRSQILLTEITNRFNFEFLLTVYYPNSRVGNTNAQSTTSDWDPGIERQRNGV